MSEKILEVRDLAVQFKTEQSVVTAVDGVSFDVHKGKTLGIVGESGSGKSVSALSVMRLIPNPPGKITNGSILFRGQELRDIPLNKMRTIRGNKIAMIFQEPMTSLNPVFTVGNQIEEVFALHRPEWDKKMRQEKSVEMLHLVGIPSPEKRVGEYPHQLSGGMRQRVMIAMGLACEPDILIADEPTTALDVTIQAQILKLMKELQEKIGMGIIMITHDLGVIAETCDHVSVMYCGKIVESAPIKSLFEHPRHPYTCGLIRSIPSFDSTQETSRQRLPTIDGMVPSLAALPSGCNFQSRCDRATDRCRGEKGEPSLDKTGTDHFVSCFHPLEKDRTP